MARQATVDRATVWTVHEEIEQLAATQHHVFTTADAAKLGYGHRAIQRAVVRRDWVRLRRGSYVLTTTWESADAVARHLLVARAVIRPLTGVAALSHTSAALALGVQQWNPALGVVHVTRLDGRQGGLEHGVAHHEARLGPTDCQRLIDDHGDPDPDFVVVAPVQAVAGAMLLHGLDQSVVMADSAINAGVVTAEALADLAESWPRMPRSRHVRLATRLMDGRAESPGETLGRLVFWRGGLPRPELQVRVTGTAPDQVAYTDYGWQEDGVVGEFDGLVKYQRGFRPGESPSAVVVREKQREEWITETGLLVRRLVWGELFTPQVVVARFRRALDARRLIVA